MRYIHLEVKYSSIKDRSDIKITYFQS